MTDSSAMEATGGYSEAWLTESTNNDQKVLIFTPAPQCLDVVEVQEVEADSH